MIYSLYIYQHDSGKLLYDKNFQIISDDKIEMFSGFFSALKSFISEVVVSSSKELKTIDLGVYTVLISYLPLIESDLVVIIDKEDKGVINKIIPKLEDLVLNYKNLFIELDYKSKQFKTFDDQITEEILSHKKIVDKSLLEDQSDILKSIWAQKGELSTQLRQDLIKERDFLTNKFLEVLNLIEKLKIAEKLIDISEKLRDDEKFIEYQKEAKILKDEVKDRKIKLEYFLKKTKESLKYAMDNLGAKRLHDGNYKDTYISLYSFSSKLKNMAKSHVCAEYQQLANKLINKNEISRLELSEVISKIRMMSDNIDEYIA